LWWCGDLPILLAGSLLFSLGDGCHCFEEGFNLFLIVAMPFSKKLRQRYDKAPSTVGMLEYAIRLGVWDSAKLARYNQESPDAK
jgi:hypothetical protein